MKISGGTLPCWTPARTWRMSCWCAVALLACQGNAAVAEVFLLPQQDDVVGAVGQVHTIYEDTLTDVARRHGLGYEEIIRANPGVDPWLPGDGTEVMLPTRFVLPRASRSGVVINIAEYRLYYFTQTADETRVSTFPISIGRMDWSTPLGRSAIVKKVRQPSWYPPASVREEYAAEGRTLARIVPPGPDNPLGDYAMRLSIPGYLIHGTNRPAGVGMRVTHGCIRMYPEDIEWLFPKVPVKTGVQLVNQPYKLGWSGSGLFLEVHPPLDEDETTVNRELTAITEIYVKATRDRPAEIDWALVDRVYRERLGVAVRVGYAVDAATPAPGATRSRGGSPAALRSVF